MKTITDLTFAALIAGTIFWTLERVFRDRAGKRRRAKDWRTDIAWWFFTPLVTKNVSRAMLFGVVVLIAVFLGEDALRERLEHGAGPVASWPYGLQVLGALFVADLTGYWVHRVLHGKRLWKVHAIHHSAEHLDWLAAVRQHPLAEFLTSVVNALVILGCGFPIGTLAAWLPIIAFMALLAHSNLPWNFGPLRFVIVSPRFHRWHHARESVDKNFAGIFPFIDLAFGTFYMPADDPASLGVSDPVPDGFLAQLAWPLRRKPGSV